MKLLLLSNSTNYKDHFLAHAENEIANFIGNERKSILFIPYAAVNFSWDTYFDEVSDFFSYLGYETSSLHEASNPGYAIARAEVIVVGGGNTWNLLATLQEKKLMQAIRTKIMLDTPYIGWSAGANLACPTIKTTNDMPIVEVENMTGLNLIPFQINPHYTDKKIENFAGETRSQRIAEFTEKNQDVYVVGLPEGMMLKRKNQTLKLIGDKSMTIFKYGLKNYQLDSNNTCNFLLT